MPDIHYLDNNNVYYAPRMGAAFSDAVTGMMRLRLAQQQREDERQRTIAEFQLARQRLQLEEKREGREQTSSDIQNKERQNIMDAATSGANAFSRLNAPTRTTTIGPSNAIFPSLTPQVDLQSDMPMDMSRDYARQSNIQDLARSLAYVRGTNPSAAGRALEPQQFSPGPVYDWNAMLMGGTPQPRMTVPMNPYQAQQVDLRGQSQDLNMQRLQFQMEKQQRMNDYLMQLLQERTRHDKASEQISAEKEDPMKKLVGDELRRRMGGTNAPTSNIKSIRQISD